MITHILNHNLITCAYSEIWDITVCIVVKGEKSRAVTLTLIGQCQMSNASELFPNTTIHVC